MNTNRDDTQAIELNQRCNILIVGGGKGGNSLIELLKEDPTSNIIGVVDLNPDAPGVQNAKKYGIPVSKTIQLFLQDEVHFLDIIIDVTGNQNFYTKLKNGIPQNVTLIGGKAAKFIWALIESFKSNRLLKKKYDTLMESLYDNQNNEEMIYGSNPVMQHVREMIHQVAPTPASVLILGETGTGKEMVANAITKYSNLTEGPYVKINCTAFSPDLLESELFGYVKGAFTGATKDKQGLLHKGDGGTIFLDEIGDITPEMQVKILRFLQFGEIRPVGGTKTKTIKARIIAATNKNLETMVHEENFRKDLYYRLNTFSIELPPLRNRKEDIPVLAYLFLNKAVAKLNKKVGSISSSAMECLNEYDYPGNIRELQSIIERAVILCKNTTIKPDHLPMTVQSSNDIYKYDYGLAYARESINDQFERQSLQHYLIKARGNVTNAAKLAKTPRRTFYRLLEKHKMNKDSYKEFKT